MMNMDSIKVKVISMKEYIPDMSLRNIQDIVYITNPDQIKRRNKYILVGAITLAVIMLIVVGGLIARRFMNKNNERQENDNAGIAA
ncbi:uncharacterized protein NEPG_00803 [Nematocida parisii ERTm1]|uniref:Uncharacterized protein n=1 Tax=Nematocida parisii (strain ERTm3) TaxID=935791 RepID=I3EKB5_NEMP3|nr:uncharacterized protein NEPG_00803 [Nematocida parisii ERTm1]EIJ89662.1 hypothetical protein NEQG_00432 [Nematocida parisii ERTm3]EIJ94136.1 hypothetical protein NEPG_00803 [Nematocida parisii ERTm1]KAI5143334.1 hypothetical protein NEPAR07_0554 [Nematocida parisii]|eukprot:XP_013058632.1 hypothetical protein NEPG_00803 [Nematocida parisii ERTm1]